MFDIDIPFDDELSPVSQSNLLDNLNPEQMDAVQSTQGPLLVLAGAGTGKTKVLTTRLAYILTQGLAFPSQILAVTFTNKAAREMVERVAKMIGGETGGLWLGTFHAIAARILRRHAELVGLKDNFTIIDTDDQLRLLKQLLVEHGVDEKKWPAKALMAVIQRWKDRGLLPEKITHSESSNFAFGKATQLYKDYQARLRSLNAVDFGDLLLYNIKILTENPEIQADYHRRFRYVLVDEYQDTNVAQYLWLRLLTADHKNICCVGDDDQSIYSWRGAEVGNILRFEKDFPGAKTIRLECNYRSTTHILGAASHLIANNSERLGKTLWTQSQGGNKIKISALWDDREEARFIGSEIEAQQQIYGVRLKDTAILVRAGFQTRAFEEAFMTMAIPYKVIGGLRFYERKEIRDVIAYIRLAVQDTDDLAFERIINLPKRGIGNTTLQSLFETSRSQGIPLMHAALYMIEHGTLKGKTATTLKNLLDQFAHWGEQFKHVHHVEVVERILNESGYRDMWKQERTIEADGRLENIRELITALQEFENITEFLEHVSLVSDIDTINDDNMVNIMTLHAAKGLEFETVFLPGWEEGLFPHQKSMDEKGRTGLEEERRLAYVGITRARKQAYICFTANRRVYNQWQSSIPSRFVDELPAEHIEAYKTQTSARQPQKPVPMYRDEYADPDYDTESYSSLSFKKMPAAPVSAPTGYAIGQRVFHQKFGYGIVKEVRGQHLDVMFQQAGMKTIIDSFVEKA